MKDKSREKEKEWKKEEKIVKGSDGENRTKVKGR